MNSSKPLVIGGQAVMEGVLMQSKHHIATAVRRPNGKIIIRHRRKRVIGFNIPFLRGIVLLIEMFIIGSRELNWSINQSIEKEDQLTTKELVLTFVLSILFALIIFKLLPLFIAALITAKVQGGNWTLNILDGSIKFTLFIGYLLLITLFPDVRRLFQYHGAEHKSVNCYEAGEPLTVKAAKRFTTRQPRCGTTFIVYVILISIFVYLLIPFSFSFSINLLLRILLLPVIAGIVYEWTRISAKLYKRSAFIRLLSVPAMAVQALTLREPNDEQLAVGLIALKRVIEEENNSKRKSS